MDTTFLNNLSFKELNVLFNACQAEMDNRKTEGQKSKLMTEFEEWLDRVHEAGFEPIHCMDESVLTYWNVDLEVVEE